MRYAILLAVMSLVPAWGQVVKPTAGALPPVSAASAVPANAAPASGSPGKAGTSGSLKRLESDFDYRLKTADPNSPIDVLGMTRGLYLQGFGVVFTTEVELVQNPVVALFHREITPADRTTMHERKLKHLEPLRKQMLAMMATVAKSLDALGANDQVVVSVRLLYQSWEDRTGLPDQIVMKADRRGAQSGDIKVDVQ